MQVVKKLNSNGIISLIKVGGVVVLPTDTAYGVCADATNKTAVKKVFQIKKRNSLNPIYVFVSDLKMAKKYGVFNKQAEEFAKKYWPGQLTIIVKKKNKKLDFVSNETTIGFRVPESKLLIKITQKFGKPITATSANLEGKSPAYNIKEFLDQINENSEKPDLIFDVGQLPKTPVSTIIDLSTSKLQILREGAISKEEVFSTLK